jgi:DNA-directed RNA polymerase specialized sigma24 family protein
MKARDYLEQLEVIEERIQSIQFDIMQLKERALFVTPTYSGDRVQSSGDLQRTASVIDRWVDKEQEMNAEIDRLIDKRLEISSTIRRLKEPNEIGVLQKLYIEKKSYEEIAEVYNRSVSWAKSIHGWALLNLQKELDAIN